MNKLDELLAKSGRPYYRGCRFCGAKNEAKVGAQLRGLDENGNVVHGTTRSRYVSLCGEHAVELWERLLGEFETLGQAE